MFRSIIFCSILLLSSLVMEVYPLRGGLIRNGRSFNEDGNDAISYRLLFLPPLLNHRGYQEFMRFGRSPISDLPDIHQTFYRGRRDTSPGTQQKFFRFRKDDSDESESARFG